mmetsp:Transcript_9418/g.16611  ORF Transcript_9418/g.16611 Transcript_9418/m.16611 type:complete len:1918 (+) Transcript_9418:318-6071(+)
MGDNEWHYTDASDQDVGPVAITVLQAQFKAGVIHQETFIWHPTEVQAWTFFRDLNPSVRAKIEPPKPRPASRPRPPPVAQRPKPPPRTSVPAASTNTEAAPQTGARPPAPGGPRPAAPQPAARRTEIPLQRSPSSGGHQRGNSNGSSQLSGAALAAATASAKRRSFVANPPAPGGNMVASRRMNRNVSAHGKSLLLNAGLATTESGWMERKTADGVPYYHNVSTGALSWDKPDEMKDAYEVENEQGNWVWVPDEVDGYVPGLLMRSRPDGRSVVQLENGSEVTTKPGQSVHPLSKSSLARTERDLTLLDSLDEGLILYNLRERFERQQQIYTWIGTILISINPYETFPIYGVENIYAYKNRGNRILDPHVYVVADEALKPLLEYGENHSILISGESGAGKTWATKQCLAYLTEVTQRGGAQVASSGASSVEGKILAANPILEAFGNAKTVRNDNSSRFGRFMEIHFDTSCGSGQIVGAHTVNYLLEKSRVVDQAQGERNFHIFHYLTGQFKPELRKRYKVDGSVQAFKYLPQQTVGVEHHDDSKECAKMHQALEEMGFSDAETDGLFRYVAAILHLGNVEFEEHGSTGSKIASGSKANLEAICDLLSVDSEKLSSALTMHISQQRDGLLKRAFNTKMASDARNALARHLYNRLFEYIIRRINHALLVNKDVALRSQSSRNVSAAGRKASGDTSFIGLLDIFGFEIFEINSFEQLCINFANEKLQQMFNRHTFTLEEQTYIDEGVPFEKIEFHDSQPLLTFLGMSASGAAAVHDGVFQLLDEQTAINGTDEKFLQAVVSRHTTKRALFSDRCKSRTAFQVFHYAGAVEYETSGFVYKNADKLYENLETAIEESSSEVVRTIFSKGDTGQTVKKTQASTFMKQLSQLEDRTNATFPRYIRCVKPNELKRPGIFNSPSCLEQLRFAGVFEAVAIRKRGYPFRKTHEGFFATYRCIEPSAVSHADWMAARKAKSWRKVAEDLLRSMASRTVPAAKDCHLGKTMILYRAEQHRALEIQRLGVLNRAAAEIQKIMRGAYVRMHVPDLRKARKELQSAINSRRIADLDTAISNASSLFFKIREAYDAEAVKEVLRLESTLAPKIKDLLSRTRDGNACFDDKLYDELDRICSEMTRYMKRDALAFKGNPEAVDLISRADNFRTQREVFHELGVALSEVAHVPANLTLTKLGALLHRAPEASAQGSRLRDVTHKAETLLGRMEEEVEMAEKLAQATASCGVGAPSGGNDNIDISLTRQNIKALQSAYSRLKDHQPESVDGVDALARGEWAQRLYSAIITAMDNAQHADDPEWELVERLVGEGQTILGGSNELFTFDETQLSLVSGELALRAQVDAIVRKLAEGIQAVNDEPLAPALDQARALNLQSHADADVRNVVAEAEYLLPQIRQTRSKLLAAIQAVSEQLLYEALVMQSECGWGESADMVGHKTVAEARTLYRWVQNLTREARIAVDALEVEPCRVIVDGCEEIRLNIEELSTLREFLGLPRDRQLLRQRDAAVALQNYRRAVAVSIAHKDLLFDSQENSDNFALEHFPKLKSPQEFAKRFGITFSKYKVHMLHFHSPTFGKIHTSLTTIEPSAMTPTGKSLHKTACMLFKNIFGIMGDKIYENVDSLVVDLIETGLTIPDLVDEMMCQVMKQVTENPKDESEARGWNLLAMLLASFPPSAQLENYLEHFLRRAGRSRLVKTLHCTLLCGPLLSAPSIEEIALQRAPGNSDVWFDGPRSKITLPKETFKGPVEPDQRVTDWRNGGEEEYGDSEDAVPAASGPGTRSGPPAAPPAPPSFGSGAPPPAPAPRQAAPLAGYGGPPPPHQVSHSPVDNLGGPPPPPPPKKRGSGRSSSNDYDSAGIPAMSGGPPQPPPPAPPARQTRAPVSMAGGPPPPPPKRGNGPPLPPPQRQLSSEVDEDDLL